MHIVRLLLDLVPELLVERRSLSRPGNPLAGLSLADRQPRRGQGRAARQPRGPVPALSLPHHHELHQDLPEEPQSGEGDRRDQEAAGRADGLGLQAIFSNRIFLMRPVETSRAAIVPPFSRTIWASWVAVIQAGGEMISTVSASIPSTFHSGPEAISGPFTLTTYPLPSLRTVQVA